jgi:hypothetical protein
MLAYKEFACQNKNKQKRRMKVVVFVVPVFFDFLRDNDSTIFILPKIAELVVNARLQTHTLLQLQVHQRLYHSAF